MNSILQSLIDRFSSYCLVQFVLQHLQQTLLSHVDFVYLSEKLLSWVVCVKRKKCFFDKMTIVSGTIYSLQLMKKLGQWRQHSGRTLASSSTGARIQVQPLLLASGERKYLEKLQKKLARIRLFHPLNSLVVTRNMWLNLLSKI